MAVYILATALLLPAAALSGGFLFGAVLGMLLAVVAATVGAFVTFSTARIVLSADPLECFGPRTRVLVEVLSCLVRLRGK